MKKLLIVLLSLVMLLGILPSCEKTPPIETLTETSTDSSPKPEAPSPDEPISVVPALIIDNTVKRDIENVSLSDGRLSLPLVATIESVGGNVRWYSENVAIINANYRTWVLDINAQVLVKYASNDNERDNLIVPARNGENFKCTTLERELIVPSETMQSILKTMFSNRKIEIILDSENLTVDIGDFNDVNEDYIYNNVDFIYEKSEDESYYSIIGIRSTFSKRDLLDVTIPSSLNGIPVKEIKSLDVLNYNYEYVEDAIDGSTYIPQSKYEYYFKPNIKYLFIPETIMSIDERVFDGGYFGEITVAQENETYKSIDGSLYSGDGRHLIMYSMLHQGTSAVVPEGTEIIGKYAFNNRTSLYTLKLPSSLLKIEDGAFNGCHRLVEIYNMSNIIFENGSVDNGRVAENAIEIYKDPNVPSAIKIVNDDYVFLENETKNILVSYIGDNRILYLPNNVGEYEIADKAFYQREDIIQMYLPSNIDKIGADAFAYCTNLYRINLDSFDNYLSMDLENLSSSPFVNKAYLYINGEEIKSIVISQNIDQTSILYNCLSIEEVAIADGVTKIGDNAFYGCTSLKKITMTDSVTEIGVSVFEGCRSLKDIKLSHSLTTVPEKAFMYCEALETIEIPRKASKIERSAFMGCEMLRYVKVHGELEYIESYAFWSCPNLRVIQLPIGIYKSAEAFDGTTITYRYHYD